MIGLDTNVLARYYIQDEGSADAIRQREAARRLARGEFDVLVLTTSMQLPHLVQMAEEEGVAVPFRDALHKMAICSIGPTTSESLEDMGLRADMEPSLPKMGILVKEAGEQASDIIARKRGIACSDAIVSGS